jgi:hypothetical protein
MVILQQLVKAQRDSPALHERTPGSRDDTAG